METILEIKNLSKDYKGFKLDNLSFNLKKGYIMGFIGPNGAGKTTTIKLTMNLIKKSSGEIKIFGMDNIDYEKEVKNRIGFVYNDSNFYENFTLMDNAKLVADFYDETFCDNLYRNLTHESIKNLDWSFRKEINDELAENYDKNHDSFVFDLNAV